MLHCPKSFHPQASALPSLRMPVRCDDSLQKPVCMSNPHEKKGMLHRPSRFSPRAQLLCCTAITKRRNAVSTAWPSLRRSTVSHRCLPKPLKKSIVASAALERINSRCVYMYIYIYICTYIYIYIYKAWLCGVPKNQKIFPMDSPWWIYHWDNQKSSANHRVRQQGDRFQNGWMFKLGVPLTTGFYHKKMN